MKFMKWHGAGNDFILLSEADVPSQYEDNLSDLAKILCHRRFGIGADGLMVAYSSQVAAIKMVYYNSDGSHAAMCGNGIRCFSSYCHYVGLVPQTTFEVETDDGIKAISLDSSGGYKVTVGMGEANFLAEQVPFIPTQEENGFFKLTVADRIFNASVLKVGVPHTVVFLDQDSLSEEGFTHYGNLLEHHQAFPERTNVNFVKVLDKRHLRVDTWERGAGLTYACGTGVCAAVAASHKLGLVQFPVTVTVTGGQLEIDIKEEGILMTGPAVAIASGEYIL